MGCINVHTKRIGEGLKVSCGLVCSINAGNILKVEPKHIFLMESNGYAEEVYIISNVEWHIEI